MRKSIAVSPRVITVSEMSARDYDRGGYDSGNTPVEKDFASKVPFYKTPKGMAIIGGVALVSVLALAGGLAGLTFYLGTSNAKVIVANATLDASMIDSSILSASEKTALISLGPSGSFKSFTLLYRASRDGFFANVFHSKCDNKSPTVVLIRSTLNNIFGGYTTATWNAGCYKGDSTAFLFSLRRRGFNSTEKFPISPSWSSYATCPQTNALPVFGFGPEISICDSSDIILCSTTTANGYYTQPSGGATHLAGATPFLTTEVEVYQVTI